MKVMVCYPMKSLVSAFMPSGCEVLAVETEADLRIRLHQYRPDAVVVFTEVLSRPVWEWLPGWMSEVPQDMVKVLVPLHRDEPVVDRMLEEARFVNTYVLPARLSFQEVSTRLQQLFTSSLDECRFFESPVGEGNICAIMSHGSAGVTSFCINYPVLLGKHQPDKRIAVVDMNREKPDLSWFCSLSRHQLSLYRPDLLNWEAAKRRNWLDVFKRSESTSNVYYTSATSRWKSHELSTLFRVLRSHFDYVFVDWGYCFPDSEALHQVMLLSNECWYFVRAEPFSLQTAARWLDKWKERGVTPRLAVSLYDREQMSLQRIREWVGTPVRGVIPLVEQRRMTYSLNARSVLVDELFPPKAYLNGLKSWMTMTQSVKREGVGIGS